MVCNLCLNNFSFAFQIVYSSHSQYSHVYSLFKCKLRNQRQMQRENYAKKKYQDEKIVKYATAILVAVSWTWL